MQRPVYDVRISWRSQRPALSLPEIVSFDDSTNFIWFRARAGEVAAFRADMVDSIAMQVVAHELDTSGGEAQAAEQLPVTEKVASASLVAPAIS